jgi:hypothetical protein
MHAITSDVSSVVIPRRPIRSTICAGATLVTLDGVTRPAMLWAALLGLKWQTVKMRRHRGENWTEALKPELRRTTFMTGWNLHGMGGPTRRNSA